MPALLVDILSLILQTIFGLLTAAFLLRAYFPRVGVPFAHPLGRFVLALSNWAVLPVRKWMPGWRDWSGLDWATLTCAWLCQVAYFGLLFALRGAWTAAPQFALLLVGYGVLGCVQVALYGLFLLILMQAVLSWVQPHSPAYGVLSALTAPLLRPIAKRMPLVGGIDLSSLVVLVLLQIALLTLPYAMSAWAALCR
jgi:YggT family protein